MINKTKKVFYFSWTLMIFIGFAGGGDLSHQAEARPEYAIRSGFTRCTTCHASPAGGGPRNLMGKAFGLRGYTPGPYNTQDIWSLDLRGVHLHNPQSPNTARGGMGVMAGNVSANLPVTVDESGKNVLHAVLTHNVGGFPGGAGGPREVYLRWELKDDATLGWLPQYALLGRFAAPFGLLTDEHLTYTKLQTETTWNNFDMGLMLSGNPTDYLHYDLAFVNGQKTGGTTFSAGNAATWGGIVNLRFLRSGFPLGVGVSGLHYEKVKKQDSPSASGVYMMLGLDQLTNQTVKGAVMVEYVVAQGLNGTSTLTQYLLSDTAYQATVKSSESRGLYTLVNWDYTDRLSFIYKYDQFIADHRFAVDAYKRHGLGFKYYLGPNLFTQWRVEKGEAGHPSEKKGTGKGASDAIWAYLQLSI